MSQYKKNILNNFMVNIFNMIIAYIISVLVSRKLGTSGKGEFAFLFLLADIIAGYGHLGVISATNYFQTRMGLEKQKIYNINLTYNIIISAIVVGIITLLYSNGIILKEYNVKLIIGFIIYTVLILLRSYLNNIYTGDERIRDMNKFLIISSSMSAFLVITTFSKLSVTLYVFIKCIEVGINVLLLLTKNNYKFRPQLDFNIIKKEIRYGINPMLANLCIFLSYKIDKFFVKGISGQSELGLYDTAVMLAELALIIPQAIANPIIARLYNLPLDSQERKDVIQQTLRYGFTSCVLLSLIGICCIPLIPLVYGKSYAPSQLMTCILFFSIPFISIGKITTAYFYSSGNVGIITKFSSISLLINCILNIILIPKLGGIGAAIATTFSYTIYGAQYIIFFRKELNVNTLNLLFLGKNEVLSLLKSSKGILKKVKR